MFANTLNLSPSGGLSFTRIREQNNSSLYVAIDASDNGARHELRFSHQSAGKSTDGRSQTRHLCQYTYSRKGTAAGVTAESYTMNFTFTTTEGTNVSAVLNRQIKQLWNLFDGSAYSATTPLVSGAGYLLEEI